MSEPENAAETPPEAGAETPPEPGAGTPSEQSPEAGAAQQAEPPAAQTPKARAPNRGLPDWARFLIKLAAIALLLWLAFTQALGVHVQRGNRMHPYVGDGDLLVYYRLEEPKVNDLVIYNDPNTGQPALSRVVAVGENEIRMTEAGGLSVNGLTREEQVFYPTQPLEGSEVPNPCQMQPGQYFLLDDYRTIGLDSRSFGPLEREDILGKVVYLFRRRGL